MRSLPEDSLSGTVDFCSMWAMHICVSKIKEHNAFNQHRHDKNVQSECQTVY